MPDGLLISLIKSIPIMGTIWKKISYSEAKKLNRSADDTDIKELKDKLNYITQSASEYWSKSNEEHGSSIAKEKSQEIILLLTALSVIINKLQINDINCQTQFIQFKQSITSGDFESISRKADNNRIKDIQKALLALTSNADVIFKEKYR